MQDTAPTNAAPTPAEAAARITTLKADGTFTARYLAGDADARQTMAQLHALAHPGSFDPRAGTVSTDAPAAPTTAEQAQARIQALRRDAEWVKRFASGDSQARGELDNLVKAAYPGETATSIDPTQPAPDPTGAELDAAFPAARPSDYTMPAIVDEGGNFGKQEMAADMFIRETLAAAGFPRENGSSLAREADRIIARTRGFTESQLDSYIVQQHAALEKLWGPKTDENIGLARQLIHELEEKRPGVRALLNSMPAVQNSATFVTAIYGQAKVLLDRANAKERK